LQESEIIAPLREECTRLYTEKATLEAVMEWQAEQAEARESLLVGQWAAWERRAGLLEQLGWDSGAWLWIAWMISQQGSGDHSLLPITMQRSTCTVVEVPLPCSFPLPIGTLFP